MRKRFVLTKTALCHSIIDVAWDYHQYSDKTITSVIMLLYIYVNCFYYYTIYGCTSVSNYVYIYNAHDNVLYYYPTISVINNFVS